MKTLLDPNDREAVMARICAVEPDTHRRWGRMTPHGMVCHVTDAFVTCLGDRPFKERSTLLSRTVIRFIGMTLPLPWPRGVKAPPEVDQERGGTEPEEFAADLARLRASADDFVARLDAESMRHPLFGKLSRAEWGRWAYRHVDHHARQFGL